MNIHKISLDKIDSTNSYAKREGARFPKDMLTVITADEQTGGRGRFQRPWLSPRSKNLLITFSFLVPQNVQDLPRIGQLLALSAAALLEELNFRPKIKWPNDLLLQNKKVGGVLAELVQYDASFQVILGLGLNVNADAAWLSTLGKIATSLLVESNQTWDLARLEERLCHHFLDKLNTYLQTGFKSFEQEFISRLAYLGQSIECSGEKGVFEGIASDGSLILKLPGGSRKKISSGDLCLS